MPKRVRIEGEQDLYEVIVETAFLKLLVNRAAQHRQTIEMLRGQMLDASRRLTEAVSRESSSEDRS